MFESNAGLQKARGVNTWFPENLNKKQFGLGHFLFLAFLNMAAGYLHSLQATLLLPPERLDKVCCRAIFRTPIAALLESLLSESEAGQLALAPSWLTNSDNV